MLSHELSTPAKTVAQRGTQGATAGKPGKWSGKMGAKALEPRREEKVAPLQEQAQRDDVAGADDEAEREAQESIHGPAVCSRPACALCSAVPKSCEAALWAAHPRRLARWLLQLLTATGSAFGPTPWLHATTGSVVQTALYGLWQTEAWMPPAAKDGVVPKNERGNVEVPPFAKALPGGTVHVDAPRVFAACRRLAVDFAPALVGFEPGRGGMLPKIQGVVVCCEVEAAVRASALEDEQARAAKARAKRCAPAWPCSFPASVRREAGRMQAECV